MKVADAAVDVEAIILKAREIPCICPRQFASNPGVGKPVSYSTCRGYPVEQVECTKCLLTWRRINCP